MPEFAALSPAYFRKLVNSCLTEHYVYDGNNVVLELDDVGTVEADFTYVPAPYAQVLSQYRDLESSFYQFDGIHNVRQLTDDAQVVTDDYRFDAWGNPISTTGSTANSQLWKGEYLTYRKDPNAGPEVQYATHHRHYNPHTGVFTSADPVKDDLNLYRYVTNDPVNRADPSGLEDEGHHWLVQSVFKPLEKLGLADDDAIDLMKRFSTLTGTYTHRYDTFYSSGVKTTHAAYNSAIDELLRSAAKSNGGRLTLDATENIIEAFYKGGKALTRTLDEHSVSCVSASRSSQAVPV